MPVEKAEKASGTWINSTTKLRGNAESTTLGRSLPPRLVILDYGHDNYGLKRVTATSVYARAGMVF
jgi:hypothetical protein